MLQEEHSGSMSSGLPRTVTNPVMGESVTFLATSKETGGEYVKVRGNIPAGAQGTPMHYHLDFEEHFKVIEGTLSMNVGDKKKITLEPGEEATAKIGIAHRFFNDSDKECVFETLVSPAGNFEKMIRATYGLANAGKVNSKGVPSNLFELALGYELSGSYIAGIPLGLQKALFGVIARIARWRGYDPEFSRYTKA